MKLFNIEQMDSQLSDFIGNWTDDGSTFMEYSQLDNRIEQNAKEKAVQQGYYDRRSAIYFTIYSFLDSIKRFSQA